MRPDDVLYVEGLGNYVSYYLADGKKLVAHGTIKAAEQQLPRFVRLHKSYLVNPLHISSFTSEDVHIGDAVLPRGKRVDDRALLPG